MKALRIVSGDPPRLEIADVPTPAPGYRQVLVRVAASGVNRADLLQLRGRYAVPPDAPADIPGLEFSGTVAALGPQCSHAKEGQRVFGLASGGTHAEYLVSPEDLLMEIPPPLSDIEAGAVPEAYITSHDALITQAQMHRGDRLLVHAAGSGVGIAAVEIAHAWGCIPFGTSRTIHKIERLRTMPLGRSATPEPYLASNFFGPDSFDDEILTRTNGAGVDIVLDPVGAAYFERNLRALASCGRLVVIATMGGANATLPLQILMRKRLRVIGTVLRSRSIEEKSAATRAFERDLIPRFASGDLKPVIDRVYPLDQAASAYSYVEQNLNFGKVVLTIA